jgi:hypothetical protein
MLNSNIKHGTFENFSNEMQQRGLIFRKHHGADRRNFAHCVVETFAYTLQDTQCMAEKCTKCSSRNATNLVVRRIKMISMGDFADGRFLSLLGDFAIGRFLSPLGECSI